MRPFINKTILSAAIEAGTIALPYIHERPFVSKAAFEEQIHTKAYGLLLARTCGEYLSETSELGFSIISGDKNAFFTNLASMPFGIGFPATTLDEKNEVPNDILGMSDHIEGFQKLGDLAAGYLRIGKGRAPNISRFHSDCILDVEDISLVTTLRQSFAYYTRRGMDFLARNGEHGFNIPSFAPMVSKIDIYIPDLPPLRTRLVLAPELTFTERQRVNYLRIDQGNPTVTLNRMPIDPEHSGDLGVTVFNRKNSRFNEDLYSLGTSAYLIMAQPADTFSISDSPGQADYLAQQSLEVNGEKPNLFYDALAAQHLNHGAQHLLLMRFISMAE